MSAIRNLWLIMRGPRSRFAPRAPASCERPASRRCGASAAAPQPDAGLDLQPAAVPEPDLARLHAEGEQLLRTARTLGRKPALAVLQIDDLPELEIVFGRRGVDRVMAAVTGGLTRAAAGQGLVVRTAPDTFALLMPGGGGGAAIAALQARFGTPCSIEVGSGPEEIFVTPDVMVHALGPQETVAQAYLDLCRYIAKARRHARRTHEGLPRTAASASLPTRAPAAAMAPAAAPPYCPPLPATIPVPLGLH